MQSHQTQDRGMSATLWVFNVGSERFAWTTPCRALNIPLRTPAFSQPHYGGDRPRTSPLRMGTQSCCPLSCLFALWEKPISKPQFPDGHSKGVCSNPRSWRVPSNNHPSPLTHATRRAIPPEHQALRCSLPFLKPCKPPARAPKEMLVWTVAESHLLPAVSRGVGVASHHIRGRWRGLCAPPPPSPGTRPSSATTQQVGQSNTTPHHELLGRHRPCLL